MGSNCLITQLTEARKSKGLKAGFVAEKCGWSSNKQSLLENGHREPNLSDLVTWANALSLELILKPKFPTN